MEQHQERSHDLTHKRLGVARALLAAPGWARVGLTSAKPSLREDAALELARAIEAAGEESDDGNLDQLQLTL